jgi:hypothetical protein
MGEKYNDMKKLLIKLGFREFAPTNAVGTIAYQRSYKTYTLYIAHSKEVGWLACISYGKTEISIPGTVDKDWINDFHLLNND